MIKASRELRDVDSYYIRGDFAFIVIQFERIFIDENLQILQLLNSLIKNWTQ